MIHIIKFAEHLELLKKKKKRKKKTDYLFIHLDTEPKESGITY